MAIGVTVASISKCSWYVTKTPKHINIIFHDILDGKASSIRCGGAYICFMVWKSSPGCCLGSKGTVATKAINGTGLINIVKLYNDELHLLAAWAPKSGM